MRETGAGDGPKFEAVCGNAILPARILLRTTAREQMIWESAAWLKCDSGLNCRSMRKGRLVRRNPYSARVGAASKSLV
jgi:hypothetical protein